MTIPCRPVYRLLPLLLVGWLLGCGERQLPEPGSETVDSGRAAAKKDAAAPPEKPGPRKEPAVGPRAGKSHALLVGCTRYTNLLPRDHLEGPANDVHLLRDLLQDMFAFPSANIVILSEEEGGKDAKRYPTRANIQREFEALIKKAGPEVRLVILLSGHGTQQPEYPERKPNLLPSELETDGLDEVFCPRDVEFWNGERKTVPNGIVDDEIRDWTRAMVKRGASVWFIADCCHSGTLIRGNPAEVARELRPVEDLKIPAPELDQARDRAAKRTGKLRGVDPRPPFEIEDPDGRVVAIYASQSNEVTLEMPLPADVPDAKPHGLLTFTLCEVLRKAKTVPTYRELVGRIREHYDSAGRNFPTPLVEGKAMDRKVLGDELFPGRSRFVLKSNGKGGWTVTGGSLHGLTEKSILRVFPEDAAAPAGHVEILRSRLLEADVAPPSDVKQWPPAKELKGGWRCEPAAIDYGTMRMRVAVEVVADPHNPPRTAKEQQAERARFRTEQQRLAEVLQPLARERGALLELVPEPSQAHWLVRMGAQSKELYLIPADGQKLQGKEPESPPIGPFASDKLTPQLEDRIARIARARGLRSLVEKSQGLETPSSVQVKIDLVKYSGASDTTGEVVPFQKNDLRLRDGDIIAFRVTNATRNKEVHVTLLFIDNQSNIKALYPRDGDAVEALKPGKFLTTDPLRVSGKTVGRERVVAVAVKAGRKPVDFSWLEQPTLVAAKGVTRRGPDDPLETALGKLFQNALYAEGRQRDVEFVARQDHVLRSLSWLTVPKGKLD